MGAETAFEYLTLAIESAHGTKIAVPTHYANLMGTLDPTAEYYEPVESRGSRAAAYRTLKVRAGSGLSADGGLDVLTLPLFLNGAIQGGVTSPASTPETGVAYLWEFIPNLTADNLESFTLFWGDPNVQIFQAGYAMVDTFTISGDASGTDGSTFSIGMTANEPVQLAAPSLPSQVVGDLITGLKMQLWLDTSSVIGTTEITGKVISAQHVYTTNIGYKYIAAGPTAGLDYTKHGLGRPRMVTTVTFELDDMDEVDLEGEVVKCRVRHNGPFVDGSVANYQFAEVDTYGRLRWSGPWGELEGTNRTVTFEIQSEVDTTLGSDCRVGVQSEQNTL